MAPKRSLDLHISNALVWLLSAASASSFLGGEYPDFVAPAMPVPFITCDVTAGRWGATGDGRTDDTTALQMAMNECGRVRGTRSGVAAVLLPRGHSFISGALNLTSRLLLRIEGELLASTNPLQYPVVPALVGYGTCRDSGYPAKNAQARHQAFISGWNLTDVWIDGGGTGTIDGRGAVDDAALGSSWNSRFRSKTLDFGRPRLLEPMFSRRIGVTNLTLRNQSFWGLHPYACDSVYVGGVKVFAPRDEGINNDDAIDPDSTTNMLVEHSVADVGDNSVAIKSGMDKAGRSFGRPSANIVFRDSRFVCETFAVGSEMSGDVYNITVHNCYFGGNGSDFVGVHLKTRRGRGGAIHGLRFRDCLFDMTKSTKQPLPFSVAMHYGSYGPEGDVPTNATATPAVFDVRFENATILLPPAPASTLFSFVGLNDSLLRDFTFKDVRTVRSQGGTVAGVGYPCPTQVTPPVWSCIYTHNFQFEGEILPPPGKDCLAGN